MQHQFAVRGAGYGALVGWVTATVVATPVVFGEGWPGLLLATFGILLPTALGLPSGALAGLACGMGAAMAVGDRTELRAALPRAVLGAMALPLLVALAGAPVVLAPAAVGTALLLRETPGILRATEQERPPVSVACAP